MNDEWRKDEDLDRRVEELLRSLPRDKQPTPELEEGPEEEGACDGQGFGPAVAGPVHWG